MEVTLRDHAKNKILLSSTDSAGNRSKGEAELLLVYNNPPTLRFLWPRERGGLNHKAEVAFDMQDPDLDPIADSSLSYRKKGEAKQTLLIRHPKDAR